VSDPEQPEYGPGGYLPPRAAARARKIVLRERMGLHWPVAAVVAGVAILALTVPFVLASQGPPGPPAVAAGPLDAIDPAGDALLTVAGAEVLVLRAGGVLRAFADPPAGARWCPASRRIESGDGAVWTAEGRLLAGPGDSLRRVDVRAYDGELYIDLTAPTTPLPPLGGDVVPACA
jgi:hypothetical protein